MRAPEGRGDSERGEDATISGTSRRYEAYVAEVARREADLSQQESGWSAQYDENERIRESLPTIENDVERFQATPR